MVLTEKSTGNKYTAELVGITVTTSKTKYIERYVRLHQINGIKSQFMSYTQVWKFFSRTR